MEVSCGTILYTRIGGEIMYVLVREPANGYCGLPKGHMEAGETEIETALRETWEETSVRAEIAGDFCRETAYSLRRGGYKKVSYFLARFSGQTPAHNPGYEKLDVLMLPFSGAYAALTHRHLKEILAEADAYIRSHLAETEITG